MDLVDIIKEKRFLGQEFLTWLWVHCERNSGLINVKEIGGAEIWFEEQMVLDAGEESITCKGGALSFAEARTAVRRGKKISKARLRVTLNGQEYRLTINAETLEITGLRLPRTLDMAEEEDDGLAGRFLDRVALINEITELVNGLFAHYLEIRLTERWPERELPEIRRWLKD
ncbi:MAG: hypothetical protein JRD68_13300 [Deltaproteobacteria bacterium]|nr:hypothetical protein [Deltaproteobacteria bacterium]